MLSLNIYVIKMFSLQEKNMFSYLLNQKNIFQGNKILDEPFL